MLDEKKLMELGIRIYNDKMITKKDEKGNEIFSDEKDIRTLCEKVFGDGSVTPDPSMLHQFNNILVKTADVVAEPTIKEMLSILANFQKVKVNTTVIYDIPQIKNRPVLMFSARGATADLIRLGQDTKKQAAQKQVFTFGAYYNPLDFVEDSVKAFKDTVNDIAEEKIKRYFALVRQCIDKAVDTDKIPKANNLIGANLTLANYRKLENRFIRMGGKPILVADAELIDSLAQQFATNPEMSKYLTDPLANELRESLNISKFSRTSAFNINNPYIDENCTKTQYPINEGFIFAGAMKGKKPVYVTEYGGLRQTTERETNTKRVKLQIDFEADVTLMYGGYIGKVKDSALTL